VTTTHSFEEPGYLEEQVVRTEVHSPQTLGRRRTTVRREVDRSYSPTHPELHRLPAHRHKFGDKAHQCGWDLS